VSALNSVADQEGLLALLEADRQLLRQRWYDEGFFGSDTVPQRMAAGAVSHPNVKMVFHSTEHPGAADLATIYSRGTALAQGMFALGLQPGDVIAAQVPNWLEGAITYSAAMQLGLVIVPIVHIYGPSEVGFIVRSSGAKALVLPTRWRNIDYRGRVLALQDVPRLEHVIWIGDGPPTGGTEWAALELATGSGPALPQLQASPDDPCLLIYTSGTTAEPKGVVHSHNTLIAEIASLRDLIGTGPEAVTLAAFPAGHIAGVLNLLRMFLNGTSSVLMDQWDPRVGAELVETYRCTNTSGAPFHLTSLIEAARTDNRDLSSMRGYMVGAASVPPSLVEAADAFGIRAYRAYGSSEHPVVTTGMPSDPIMKRATTDGRLTAGNEIRILGDDDQEVTPGTDGEIAVRGPEQFIRYQNPAHDLDSFLAGGWFRTGDIGRFDDDGYLTITDRKKDVIIRGGENIASKEVEDLLALHTAVLESAAVGRPDGRYGERVMVFVLLRPGADSAAFDLAEVQQHFAGLGVAKQKTPEFLQIVTELPRGMSGKVKKFELRAVACTVAASQPDTTS
jgi:acyl-CoA synthetase (AMP-forming)/AMP-acid ligase II